MRKLRIGLMVFIVACTANVNAQKKDSIPVQEQDERKVEELVEEMEFSSDSLNLSSDSGETIIEAADDPTLKIIGVGDIMMGTNYPSTKYLAPNDGRLLLAEVDTILRNADLTFGNLEGTLLDKGGNVKRCSDPTKCYAFRSPERYATYLKDAGFDVLSIANNHSGDFGSSGRANTQRILDSNGIAYAGLLSCPTAIFTIDSITYGFAAFAPNSGTVDIRRIAAAEEIVKKLADTADVVIVSFHGGAEGRSRQHMTKRVETFLGENRGNVYEFAHRMIDAGADVIFGHGPHVVRAIEVYKNRFIAYSLGNFCTYARFNLTGVNGYAPIVEIETTVDGEFKSGKIHSFLQIGEGGPESDSMNKAYKKIQQLTNEDFPNHNIKFEEDGTFILK
jgi:poly-gamma-glutamate capsule biosynthesis protein CapA/YwtB (metallophosphatase superfamily)